MAINRSKHSLRRPFWRQLLHPLGWLYGSGAAIHRWWHHQGGGTLYEGPLLLIAVGNLSVGGTGKTPHVAHLYQLLAPYGSLAIVSRGYGRQSKGVRVVAGDASPAEVGDEPLALQRQLPQALILVAERRAEGIEQALALRPDLDAVLLDDALQHWAIRPDCAILLTTFDAPFYEDAVLPVGRLREFKKSYQRADVLIVTKCPPDLNDEQRHRVKTKLHPLPHQLVLFSHYQYEVPYSLQEDAAPLPWSYWIQQTILVVTALADTQYLETFVQVHSQAFTLQRYPDHHAYTEADLNHLAVLAQGRPLWITEKDAVKWRPFAPILEKLELIVYVLPIRVVLEGEEQLLGYLRQALTTQKNAHPQDTDGR